MGRLRTATDWVSRFADEVIAVAEHRAPGRPIICASGLSPSGPIHLGNLREVMTPHLVSDEIRRRGLDCLHILSWDDYDRLRKVPAGVDPAWQVHIGKALTNVPAPPGSAHPNWAEHFRAPMEKALAELGVEYRPVSQTAQYTSGVYREQILFAMRERKAIDHILQRYRTKERDRTPAEVGAAGYVPYRPYCSACERDLTTVTGYDDRDTSLSYTCACGHRETVRLDEFTRGKLVWKVDWPMRWAYEGVVFEPSGVDHSTPGSSFDVGTQLVREIFDSQPPIGPMYAFVGITGMAKMSSSRGEVPTPSDALDIMEPSVLRWLYARRRPNQSFKVSFDSEIQRLYDEWDALDRRVTAGSATAAEAIAHTRAASTAKAALPSTKRPIPYRTLASIIDITTGDPEQTLRILRELDPTQPVKSLTDVRPRLDCAERWVLRYVPAERRTQVRAEPDLGRLAALTPTQRDGLTLFLDHLHRYWSLQGLTTLVYGIPKLLAGLPFDTDPTAELRAAQREFFALLYELLLDQDTGPRLPTLLLALGAERVRTLLGSMADRSPDLPSRHC